MKEFITELFAFFLAVIVPMIILTACVTSPVWVQRFRVAAWAYNPLLHTTVCYKHNQGGTTMCSECKKSLRQKTVWETIGGITELYKIKWCSVCGHIHWFEKI